jgi:Tfp pilus assembly protein PilV
VPSAASELQAQTDLQRQAADQSAEFEIEQLVNQVLQATAVHPQQAEDLQSEAEHQVLANQVVERVQARIASLLPDLVHEVMSEIQPSPTDTGKPSDPQELK